MPTKDQLEEYIISDYGMVYMGTELNVCQRPWTYGQVHNVQWLLMFCVLFYSVTIKVFSSVCSTNPGF